MDYVKLRPHHLFSIETFSENNGKDVRTYIEKLNGCDFLNKLDCIMGIINENSLLVKITSTFDDLCKICLLNEICKKKDYKRLKKLIRKESMAIFGDYDKTSFLANLNPEEADAIFLLHYELEIEGFYKL